MYTLCPVMSYASLHTFQFDIHTSPIQTPPQTLVLPPPIIPPVFDVPQPLPTHLTYLCSFKVDLLDLSKIPLLSTSADWPIWFRGILDMIDNLCLFHHISPEPAPGVFSDHMSIPSYHQIFLRSSFFPPVWIGQSGSMESWT